MVNIISRNYEYSWARCCTDSNWSIEASEILSSKLMQAGIHCWTLNNMNVKQTLLLRQVCSNNCNQHGWSWYRYYLNWKAKLAKLENPTAEDEVKHNGNKTTKMYCKQVVCMFWAPWITPYWQPVTWSCEGDPGVSRFYLSLEDDLMSLVTVLLPWCVQWAYRKIWTQNGKSFYRKCTT